MDWDLTAYFPTFDGPEHRAFAANLRKETEALTHRARRLEPLGEGTLGAWSEVLVAYESLCAGWGHLRSYTGALAAADVNDEAVRSAQAKISRDVAQLRKLEVELRRAVAEAEQEHVEAFVALEDVRGAAFFVHRLREEAQYSMTPALEGLAADLASDGIDAWGRLYDHLAGGLTFETTAGGAEPRTLPMSQRRSLMADPDRTVRQAAFEGGNRAWERESTTLAAALNHIAGTRHTLNAKRGVDHFLDVALFDAAISRRTLDAMFEAVQDGADRARRYLRIKARAEGRETVAWYDLEAPLRVPNDEATRIDWEAGTDQVRAAFGRAYPALASFFDEVVAARWVDHSPRPGKQSGAFCTSSSRIEQSRIFMTFEGSASDVSTLAHEVGHAFHNRVMKGLRPLARRYPMTLAESASTFAELLLGDGLMSDPSVSPGQRARLLGETLNDAVAFLLDIPVRFEFERAFYERRGAGEVPARELCALMASTQQRIFGDVLDPAGTDPWFWASKLHFFITEVSFYNFPYTFGYLLSRGLFAEFKRQGPAFLPRYEAFLEGTGGGLAHELARATLGQDLEQPEFWSRAIATLDEPLSALERVAVEHESWPPTR